MSAREWQKEIIEKYEQFLVSEDDLMHEYDCFRCGGKCCINNDVLINPYDVWRIVTNEKVSEALGIYTTHDLFTRRGKRGEPLLRYYLGPESRMPLACINMIRVRTDLTICPFNAPVIKGKDMEDIERYVRDGLRDAEFLRADDGSPVGLCVLEQAKPTICRAFPLGRAGKAKDANDKFPKMRYIRVDSKTCDKFKKPESAITVREYVKRWDLDKAYEMSDKVYELYRLLGDRVKSEAERYFLGIMFYNFDIPLLECGGNPKEIRKARSAEFEQILGLVKSVIEEHKTP
jgi:hypothetical protein